MFTVPGVVYLKDERYLPDYLPIFAVASFDAPLPEGSEYRWDGDHWTKLEGFPVDGWLRDLDPFLEIIPEDEAPAPLAPENIGS